MEISINCPVCSSSNYYTAIPTSEVTCRDCGFELRQASRVAELELNECVFCGNSRWFYWDSPFGLGFLGRRAVCYVCEAEYKNINIDNPERGFSPETSEEAQGSSFAEDFRERVKKY